MASILRVPLNEILVPEYRQRKEIEGEALGELMESIQAQGLLHPLVIRNTASGLQLVAGERRLRAISLLAGMAVSYRFAGEAWSPDHAPCVSLGDLPELEALEAEYCENTARVDLTWQEKAGATALLNKLRSAQAHAAGKPAPTPGDLSLEIRGSAEGDARETTRRELILAGQMHRPEVSKAKSLEEAWKAHTRGEEVARNEALAARVGATYSTAQHELVLADSLEWVRSAPGGLFDVILTDPPYGIGADNFGDGGGRLAGAVHHYDDSPEAWEKLISVLATEWFRIARPEAHLYVCCDIDGFHFAREKLREASWWVHRTPLINYKPDGNRVPWPQHGPQRKWEMILYAVKGKKPVTTIRPDVIETRADKNLLHGAQKPVVLYTDLLRRSVKAGDKVLDCFGGTGTILEACHQLKCFATYVEKDPASYGIAVQRLEGLK